MKLLTRCDHPLQAAHLANALRAAGVRCEVRNTQLASAIGDIPWLECAPQLWVLDDLDEARAQLLLAELRRAPDGPPWTCAACGEVLEAQFGQCWKCGAARPL
ncbi:MAG: DUF2007 domain-containing protein [Betaproteobacteria bacterium]|jgi:hypothetical protein